MRAIVRPADAGEDPLFQPTDVQFDNTSAQYMGIGEGDCQESVSRPSRAHDAVDPLPGARPTDIADLSSTQAARVERRHAPGQREPLSGG